MTVIKSTRKGSLADTIMEVLRQSKATMTMLDIWDKPEVQAKASTRQEVSVLLNRLHKGGQLDKVPFSDPTDHHVRCAWKLKGAPDRNYAPPAKVRPDYGKSIRELVGDMTGLTLGSMPADDTPTSSAPQVNATLTGGLKYDSGKLPLDLLDPVALEGLAAVLQFGANKYEAHNWRKGISQSRLIGAALRHLFAVMKGEDTDPESGLPHVDHLGCCWMFLSNMQKTRPDLDDRYKASVADVMREAV